jgi:hypothetical protein
MAFGDLGSQVLVHAKHTFSHWAIPLAPKWYFKFILGARGVAQAVECLLCKVKAES